MASVRIVLSKVSSDRDDLVVRHRIGVLFLVASALLQMLRNQADLSVCPSGTEKPQPSRLFITFHLSGQR